VTSEGCLTIIQVVLALVGGIALLLWSATRLIEGAAAAAWHLRVPALLVGMVVIGFGTSLPEFTVSLLSGLQGTPSLALGNAYGSNIANIGLVLGLSALLRPVLVHSRVLRVELPILCVVTAASVALMWDGELSVPDGASLLVVFATLAVWSVIQGRRGGDDALGVEMQQELDAHPMTLQRALIWVAVGLVLLLVSSRALVWGAVEAATLLGVSDLLIGLTVVAVGTSLPELAAALAAVRKDEPDLALGNVLGSNLFNTLGVVGVAVVAGRGMDVPPELLPRDMLAVGVLTVSLYVLGHRFRKPRGRINRHEGAALLLFYMAYTALLIVTAGGGPAN